MIETFKIIKIYPKDVTPVLELHTGITRGHAYKLSKTRSYKSARHYLLSARIFNLWSSLPNNVVEVDAVIHFEKRVDKFWQNVEFKFDLQSFPSRPPAACWNCFPTRIWT